MSLAEGCTYSLTVADNGYNGLPVVTGDISIEGNDAIIRRSADAPAFRIFAIAAGGTLTLRRTTISGGLATTDCPSPRGFESIIEVCGGGIANAGTLRVEFGRIVDNSVVSTAGLPFVESGGLDNDGTATLLETEVSGNEVSSDGGAIGGGIGSEGALAITGGTVTLNRIESGSVDEGGVGAGVFANGPLSVDGARISGNRVTATGRFAGGGGVAVFFSTLSMTKSVVERNSVTAGDEANGAGILVRRSSSRIIETLVRENMATAFGSEGVAFGAGVSAPGAAGELTLQGSRVENNIGAGSEAIGAGLVSLGTTTIRASRVAGNAGRGEVVLGGGLALYGPAEVLDTDVSANTVGSSSAGTAVGAGIFEALRLTLRGSVVRNNRATSPGGLAWSGGVHVNPNTSLTAVDSPIIGNTAEGDDARAGGLHVRPGGVAELSSSPVKGNRVSGRIARGGGIVNAGSTALKASPVVENAATGSSAAGGGIFSAAGTVLLDASPVKQNTPENCAPAGVIPGCAG